MEEDEGKKAPTNTTRCQRRRRRRRTKVVAGLGNPTAPAAAVAVPTTTSTTTIKAPSSFRCRYFLPAPGVVDGKAAIRNGQWVYVCLTV